MKRFEQLGLRADSFDVQHCLEMVNLTQGNDLDSEYDIASNKGEHAFYQHMVALAYALLSENETAVKHARVFLVEAEEFFLGDWRQEFRVNDGKDDPNATWWKKQFVWMDIYSGCLLWGGLLKEWELLNRISAFPDETCCMNNDSSEQERDSLIAIAAVVRGDSMAECRTHFDSASTGPKKICKLLILVLKSVLDGDESRFSASLGDYLTQYKKSEFPKNKLMKKVSYEGTFLVHWARHRGLKAEVPKEYEPHIIDFKP